MWFPWRLIGRCQGKPISITTRVCQLITLRVNGVARSFNGDGNMPLPWYLCYELATTSSKFGCGVALYGACTVHADGEALKPI